MLTQEILKANAVLASLTDEQVKAIETLSQNDENSVIGNRFGEVYRQLDATILKTTGVERNGDEKTYNYLERATAQLADKVKESESLRKDIESLTKEKTKLEKMVAEGVTDAEARKSLAQAQKDLTAITKQYNELKTLHDNAESRHQAELFGLKVENEISHATQGIKFKAGFPTSVTDVILRNSIDKIKGMKPEFIDNGNGGKVLAFKDNNGAILRNPENQLNPYTAQDLLLKELKDMGVLDEGRKQEGIGTQPTDVVGGGSNHIAVDITGAKTRTEAYEAITQTLMAQGMTKGSSQFEEAMSQAWKDNNIASLPMQ
jgi:hypothetical protein